MDTRRRVIAWFFIISAWSELIEMQINIFSVHSGQIKFYIAKIITIIRLLRLWKVQYCNRFSQPICHQVISYESSVESAILKRSFYAGYTMAFLFKNFYLFIRECCFWYLAHLRQSVKWRLKYLHEFKCFLNLKTI